MAVVGRPALMEQLGRSAAVTYDDRENVPTVVSGIVGAIGRGDEDQLEGRIVRARRTVGLSIADVAAPVLKAVLTIDGDKWEVESIESQSAGMVWLVCVQLPASQRSRQGYRSAQ